MNILFNTVMVKFDRDNDEVLFESGEKLFISTGWEPLMHAVTSGVVTHVPNKLIFNRKNPNSVQYDVDMEVQVGDRVIFDFKAESEVRKVAAPIDGSYPLRYDDIYVVIREGEVIPINGIVLVEACDTTEEEDVKKAMEFLHLPDTVLKEKSEVMGYVRYIGTPCRGFLNAPAELTEVDDHVSVGDKVLFHHAYAVELQYSMHQIINKGKVLYRMRRKDIFAVMEKSLGGTIDFKCSTTYDGTKRNLIMNDETAFL